jgi:hypothetical protein
MPRRLIALAFVLAGANTAIADDMKMPINSGDCPSSNGLGQSEQC